MKFLLNLISKLKKQDQYFWSLVLIVVFGAFLRFYNLEASQQFLADQGRDALVVSQIFKEKDPVFIGPVTSIGNMYLGPAYYYFMLPFLWLTYPSPMGPIFAVALLSTVTIVVVFKVAAEFFSARAGLIAAALFAFSPAVITFSRFSWNPNPAPFVMIVLIWGIYRALTKNSWYWLLAFFAFSLLMQLHYVALLAGGVIGVFWLFDLFSRIKKKQKIKDFALSSFVSSLILILSFVPLILFDLKHNGLNVKAFQSIFAKEEAFAAKSSTISKAAKGWFSQFEDRFELVFMETTIGKTDLSEAIFILIVIAGLVFAIFSVYKSLPAKNSNKPVKNQIIAASILTVCAALSLIGLAFYQHEVYMHYVTFLFPVVFILLGFIFDQLLDKRPLIAGVSILIFAQFFALNMVKTLHLNDAGWQIKDIRNTSQTIVDNLKPNESYDLVLLSDTKDIYGYSYRYFLHTFDRPPLNDEEKLGADALVIIDEQNQYEKPLDEPVYEIVVFPNKEPDQIIEIPDGPSITILRRE